MTVVPIPLANWLKLLEDVFETQTRLDNVVLKDTKLTTVVDLEMLLVDGGAFAEALSLPDPVLALEGGGPDVTPFTQVGMLGSLSVWAKADALRLRL